MLSLLYICLVVSRKVKIVSSETPTIKLAVLRKGKGTNVRFIEEDNIDDYTDQDVFNINGEETRLENGGEYICGKSSGVGVVTCESEESKKSLFKIIDKGSNVKLQTEKKYCLTIAGFDKKTNGHHVHLKKCTNDVNQEFNIVDLGTPASVSSNSASFEIDLNLPTESVYSPYLSRYYKTHSIGGLNSVIPSPYHEINYEIPSSAEKESMMSRQLLSSYKSTVSSDLSSIPTYRQYKRSFKNVPSSYYSLIKSNNLGNGFSQSFGYRKRSSISSTY